MVRQTIDARLPEIRDAPEDVLRGLLSKPGELGQPPVERRGCQLSIRVRAGRALGRALFEHLEQHGVLCDWREPDVIRAAPVPFYNSFDDAWRFADALRAELAG